MGEFADYALDDMMDIDELQQNHDYNDDYTNEELFDYDGLRFPHVFDDRRST